MTTQRYGGMARFFHWTMAVLIVMQFFKLGDRIDEGEHWLGQTIVPWHISVGSLLFVLIILRLITTLSQRGQRPTHIGATALLIKGGHWLLYACMVLMPITGMLTMVGNGYGLNVFGVQLVTKTEIEIGWMANLGSYHSPIAWLFVALVIGHIGAAFYHHWVKKDDTMQRMLG
jgi:cytochrome b561